MSVNRRVDQEVVELMPGVTGRILANRSTGSEMLTITEATIAPGAEIGYHRHANADETIFVLEGSAEMVVDGHRFTAGPDDTVLTPRGRGHAVRNSGDSPLKFIAIFPIPDREIEPLDTPSEIVEGRVSSATFREVSEPIEFLPGVLRYEMAGDFIGAESTYFSELVFSPEGWTQTHYHPAHEEGIYCLSGEISAAFGQDEVLLQAGDIYVPPPGVRHGNRNRSSAGARVLAIHPVLNPPPRVDVD
ncbi:MAG: cupin domain-containing protein [Dehalococcoidia bacterium]|jgi:quercetin dioxygenase-like cupin family protein|nr:cupin domain-containing protein [Dehalococcoidia bacterium]